MPSSKNKSRSETQAQTGAREDGAGVRKAFLQIDSMAAMQAGVYSVEVRAVREVQAAGEHRASQEAHHAGQHQ
ncbi:hypothetical protein [Anaeromusa sp.]|uniref:hypothetical protein n=1 Tax=Anaeromusa sp. TaxID=1872520 RepID=UPI002631201F|nr:hypothetical protein [Anaeromusa sp.]MDD3157309.1 hypothetical protein [Anaeromusa sp.]